MSEHTPFNYSRITDQIYLGTNACCQTHFDERLLALGVLADISLEKESLDSPQGVEYFLWLPVKDLEAPTQKQLEYGSESINFFVENDIKVYVHCRLGHGRSPTLVIGYLISVGKSYDEACAIVKEKRPEIHLEEGQSEALRVFEKRDL